MQKLRLISYSGLQSNLANVVVLYCSDIGIKVVKSNIDKAEKRKNVEFKCYFISIQQQHYMAASGQPNFS